jgi:hypothetical protein
MNKELALFEKICDINGAALNGYKASDEDIEKSRVALQAFHNKPTKIMQKKIQAVGVSTDFPIIDTPQWNVTIEMDNFDMGWELAYKNVSLSKGRLDWTIYNVANSLTFYKVEEGQRIEVANISGGKVKGECDYYGGAIGWTDKMIRAREIPAMIDLATIFRNKFFVNKANNFYALIAAAASNTTVNYQGAAADGVSRRIILTINQAAFQLGDTNKDKGYGDAANVPFILYANPQDEEAIEAAFRVTSGQLAAARENATSITGRRIKRVYTYNSNITAGQPVLCWPGQKAQKAEVMGPTTYTQEIDVLTLNRVQAVWSIYGGIIADTDQFLRFNLS